MSVIHGALSSLPILKIFIFYFVKKLFGTNRKTTIYMVYHDLARFPIHLLRKIAILKYWLKVLQIENCIH